MMKPNSTKARKIRQIYWTTGIAGFVVLLLTPGLNNEMAMIGSFTTGAVMVGLSIYGGGLRDQSAWPSCLICILGMMMLCHLLSPGELGSCSPFLLVCLIGSTMLSIAASAYYLLGDFPDPEHRSYPN